MPVQDLYPAPTLSRYPIIERAVSDMDEGTLSDPAFRSGVRSRITKLLQEDGTDEQQDSSCSLCYWARAVVPKVHFSGTSTPMLVDQSPEMLGVDTSLAHTSDVQHSRLSNGTHRSKNRQDMAVDSDESGDDSAMEESPVSEAAQNEDKAPFSS